MTLRAWAELLRVSALFTVPGDALAGAATAGVRPNRGTALAVGASLCLYEAGMALNDWADRDEDAVERPHRPIPSGRITPNAALAAAGGLTATGLLLASRAGRPALALSTALAATVWAYDLRLKHTPAGPAAMGAARALDVLLGATATRSAAGPVVAAADATKAAGSPGRSAHRGRTAKAVEPLASGSAGSVPAGSTSGAARVRGTTSLPVAARAARPADRLTAQPARRGVLARLLAWADGSVVGRTDHSARPSHESVARTATRAGGAAAAGPGSTARQGATATPSAVPRAALVPAALLGAHTVAVTTVSRREVYGGSVGAPLAALVVTGVLGGMVGRPRSPGVGALVGGGLAAAYVVTAGRPFLHAALNPSPQLTQRAVGGGIRAMIPFQAALAARGGAPGIGLAVMGLVPLARKLAKKVSVT
ncbi:UbiA family prenyltransferase [Streptomyces sp. NBC_01508]|uniref:UbiA family prenyltransferase n=1 Tax=Streptomyces sp. NBC_01508 TaxID=2903888 RepID=UPI00386B4408